MQLEPTTKADHTLRVSARLITSSTILHLSAEELERAVSQEQVENPAFEVIEQPICLFCGSFMRGQTCVSCGYPAQLTQPAFTAGQTANEESSAEQQWSDYPHYDVDDYLDEGTVSRAIAHKYGLLPDGRLMPVSDFFDGSLGVKDVIRELISSEEPRRRLSDEELARLLTARGIPMARRTVTKYREEMGIASSRER